MSPMSHNDFETLCHNLIKAAENTPLYIGTSNFVALDIR